jgi:hypothetical protein
MSKEYGCACEFMVKSLESTVDFEVKYYLSNAKKSKVKIIRESENE